MTLSASRHSLSGIEPAGQAFIADAVGVETSCQEWDNEGGSGAPSIGIDLQSSESLPQTLRAANGAH